MGPAEGLPRGVIDKDGPGRPDPRHDVADGADGQGCNAPGFNQVGDETHGLVAPRSVGNEHGQVHARFGQLVGQVRGQPLLDFPVKPNAAVDGKMKRGHAADQTLFGGGFQCLDGKDNFRIFTGDGPEG